MEHHISFVLWHDSENGKSYVKEFVDGLGPEKAIKIALILANDYGTRTFSDLMRDKSLVSVEGREGLYYIRITRKKLSVRLFGVFRGTAMYLVHGVKKTPSQMISEGHYDTAENRIRKIPQ